MKYKIINTNGHGFPLGTIVKHHQTAYYGWVFTDNKGLNQYLSPDNIVKLPDHLNVNIRIL